MAAWIALQVRTGYELETADNVKTISGYKEIDSILSIVSGCRKIVRMNAEGKRLIPQSLYPGYIFVQIERLTGELWHFLKQIPGVLRVLDRQMVDDDEINRIREICLDQAEVEVVINNEPVKEQVSLSEVTESTSDDQQDVKKSVKENLIQDVKKLVSFIKKGKRKVYHVPMKIFTAYDWIIPLYGNTTKNLITYLQSVFRRAESG